MHAGVRVKSPAWKVPFLDCVLKDNRDGARQSSSGSWFHNMGATAKKVPPLVEDVWTSLRVAPLRSPVWDHLVDGADVIGERWFDRQHDPKLGSFQSWFPTPTDSKQIAPTGSPSLAPPENPTSHSPLPRGWELSHVFCARFPPASNTLLSCLLSFV